MNPSLGDIVGQQVFIACAGDSVSRWNVAFWALGSLVFFIGLINLIFLREYPSMLGLEVKEQGQLLNPEKTVEATDECDLEDGEDIPSMPFNQALCVPGVFPFALSFFFIKFAFYGVYYWVPTYLQDELGYS